MSRKWIINPLIAIWGGLMMFNLVMALFSLGIWFALPFIFFYQMYESPEMFITAPLFPAIMIPLSLNILHAMYCGITEK